jgi:poly(beta-D-mannuronate) lyase
VIIAVPADGDGGARVGACVQACCPSCHLFPPIWTEVPVLRRRRRVSEYPRRRALALTLALALVTGAGVTTAILLPDMAPSTTVAPPPAPAPPPGGGPVAAPGNPGPRPLDDSFLDGDDDPVPVTARTVKVAGSGALSDALDSVTGGTTLVLADGTYDGDFTVSGVNATPAAPVVVRAANPGKAVIASGAAIVVKNSAHVVVAGLTFKSGASTLLKLDASNNVRVTHNTFERGGGGGEESSKWLYVGGAGSHDNRIDHNSFRNKSDPGNYLTLDGSPTQISQRDRIDHNRFAKIGPRVENEKEAVRLGWSDISKSSGFTTFEWNLLEECDGDPEVVSVKASDMTIRYNTVRKSQGVMSLRHGDRNSLYGNVVLGEGRPGTGGIRIYGADNRVFNNYIAGTTGTGYDSALSVDGGDAEPGGGLNKHHRVDNALVVFNTLIDNATGIVIGENYPKPPVNLTLENNLLADSGDVRQVTPPAGGSLANNTVGTKSALGLTQDGEAWKLAAGSPEIDKAVGRFDFVAMDFEGRPRSGAKDVGADEHDG